MQIDAKGMYYQKLNALIKDAVDAGETQFVLDNVNGQRYIGTNINQKVSFTINGVPGNDLATFMNGPEIVVNANAQDSIGNTMNNGKIIVHGNAGDVLGYAMRGGQIFIQGDVGYRVGIHMKQYGEQVPAIVIGGCAGDFLGEYMAGGTLVVLGLNETEETPITGDCLATGMHGGVIYLRGQVEDHKLGKEVAVFDLDAEDEKKLTPLLQEYAEYFGVDYSQIISKSFCKLLPVSSRPYGRLYAY